MHLNNLIFFLDVPFDSWEKLTSQATVANFRSYSLWSRDSRKKLIETVAKRDFFTYEPFQSTYWATSKPILFNVAKTFFVIIFFMLVLDTSLDIAPYAIHHCCILSQSLFIYVELNKTTFESCKHANDCCERSTIFMAPELPVCETDCVFVVSVSYSHS